MSEHNALKYAPQLSGAARAAVGLGDDDEGMGRLSETLTPILDLWAHPDWALLRGEILYGRFIDSPAVALRFSSVELVNPVGSGRIAIVDAFQTPGGSADVVIDTGAALGVTSTLRGVARDGRWPNLGETSRCTLVTGDLAAGVTLPQIRMSANTMYQGWEYVITPGRKLFFVNPTVATALQLNIVFRERNAFPGELQARG